MIINISLPSLHRQDISHRDILSSMYHSLCDLGHTVYVNFDDPIVSKIGLNIILIPQILIKNYPDKVRAIIESNVKYILVEEQPLNPDGKSYGMIGLQHPQRDIYTDGELVLYSNLLDKSLFSACVQLEPCDAMRLYSGRVEYLPLLYHPCLEKIRHFKEKQFDVLFFGSVASPTRQNVLNRLQASGLKCVILGYCDYLVRDSYLASSRIVLNIPYEHHAYSLVSPYRIPFLAANKMAALTSAVRDREGLLKLCHVAQVPDLVDACKIYLNSGDIASEGERVYDEYRSMPTMAAWWKTMLDKYL